MRNKIKLDFTGERLIPEINRGESFFYEHLARYLFAGQFVKEKIVLDAGCGSGYGSFIISKYGFAKKIYSVDISTEALSYARRKYNCDNIIYSLDNVERLSNFHDKTIDVVLAFEIIEHLNKQELFLKRVLKCLKENGLLIISTPNKYRIPAGNPYHTREYTSNEFKKLLRKYFKFVDILYQEFEFSQVIKSCEKNNFLFEDNFIKKVQESYVKKCDPKNSQYLIAVCSMNKCLDISSLTVNTKLVDGLDLSKGVIPLNNEFKRIKKDLINLNIANNVIKNELDTIKRSKFYKLWIYYLKLKKKFLYSLFFSAKL